MLSSLVKQHNSRLQEHKALQEQRKKDANVAVSKFTNALLNQLNSGISQAYFTQKRLDHEARVMQTAASQFVKQTQQWLKLMEDFHQALKEIGDVENWARSIETDLKTVANALEYVWKAESNSSSKAF